jgi:hypothetical protein
LPPRVAPVLPTSNLSAVTWTVGGLLQYLPEQHPVAESTNYYGEYLQPQLNLLARIILPGATVMEIGSGIGVHAVFLAKTVGPSGHLFLYEARTKSQLVLRQNLSSNGISNVTIMKNGVVGPPSVHEYTEDILRELQSNASFPHPETTTETIDELRLERLNCLKINEFEQPLEVLRGAVDTLWRLRPLLFVAVPDQLTFTEIAEFARTCSYQILQMSTPLFNPSNFNRRDRDVFPDEAALALLAVPEEIEMDIVLDGCVELK